VNNDLEIWLLFAPFWLLGTFAALGALWHLARFAVVHGHAHAAGHVPKFSPFRRLNWHELTDDGRHHLKRAFISVLAFVCLTALGLVVGVVWALWRG